MSENFDEDLFDDLTQAVSVMWYLVSLLGGEVTFPTDPAFWDAREPKTGRLAVRAEGDNLILVAQTLTESWETTKLT